MLKGPQPDGCGPQRVEKLDTLQRGQQPRTAAPNASISPFGIPFDKILRQIAHSSLTLLAHNLPQNFPVGVAVVGTCPPTATFLTFLRQNKNGKTDKNGRQVLFITTVSTVSATCSQASMQDSR